VANRRAQCQDNGRTVSKLGVTIHEFRPQGVSSLTGEGSASAGFGAYTVDVAIGEGRFGPVFRAHDADGAPVIVRVFTQAFSAYQRDRVSSALEALCQAPLEHPSIARPIACGIAEDGRLYVVHTYLAGTPLADFSTASGRRGVDDVVNRVTYLAGALDFAAAANVVHGALSESDVIFSSESAGVSGLGLVQALESAGVAGFEARRENDVAALMEIAEQLLGEQASPAARSLLSGPVPGSALAFAAALHRTLDTRVDLPPPVRRTLPGLRQGSGQAGRSEAEAAGPSADADPRPMAISDGNLPFSDVGEFSSEADASPESTGELVDIQLRHDEERLEAPLMFGAIEPAAESNSSRRGSWLVIGALALALGIFAGYAGGFLAGRDTPPSPPAAVAQTEAPKPASPKGQTFSDGSVDDVAKRADVATPSVGDSEPAPVEPVSAPPPAATGAARNPTAAPRVPAARRPAVTPPPSPARTGPAAMMVDSRPAGAQVFVDGRSVGYTPLVVGDLAPGTHSIRMQLSGHRPWVTAVTLSPGARERVAASLEQQ
jgi:hypothetical protein